LKRSTGTGTATISIPVTNQSNGLVEVDTGTLSIPTLTNLSGSTLTGGSYLVRAALQLDFHGNKLLTNAATVTLRTTASAILNELAANAIGSLATNTGSLTITSSRKFSTDATTFTNSGAVIIGDGSHVSTFTVNGAYTQTGGTTTIQALSSLTPTGAQVNVNGGTLRGAGTVTRPVATTGTGAVQNASTAGPLNLGAGYGGTGQVKVLVTSATVVDRVAVTGTATLTGSKLAITTKTGFFPVDGQTYTVLTCTTSCTGPFGSVGGTKLANGGRYTVHYNGTSVTLSYKAPVPAVTAISPTSGPVAGGTAVTITGVGFTGATTVHVGAVSTTSFFVLSDTSVLVASPAHAAGTVDVTVTTAGGTSPAVVADRYTYA
jgi:hypothetical protein